MVTCGLVWHPPSPLLPQTTVPPQSIGCTSFTEDLLLRHAQFIVEQVPSTPYIIDFHLPSPLSYHPSPSLPSHLPTITTITPPPLSLPSPRWRAMTSMVTQMKTWFWLRQRRGPLLSWPVSPLERGGHVQDREGSGDCDIIGK